MSDVSKINGHSLKDATARTAHDSLASAVENLANELDVAFQSIDQELDETIKKINIGTEEYTPDNNGVLTLPAAESGEDGKNTLIMIHPEQLLSRVSAGVSKVFDNADVTFNREFEDGETCFTILKVKEGGTYVVFARVSHYETDRYIFTPTYVQELSGWTEADKVEITNNVLASLPIYNGEVL